MNELRLHHRVTCRTSHWFLWRAWAEEYIPDQYYGPHQSAYWHPMLATVYGFTAEHAISRASRQLNRYLLKLQKEEARIIQREARIIQRPFEGVR